MGIFDLSLLSNPEKKKEKALKQYEHEKKIAQSLDMAARLKLARSPATQAEILYYLAQHDADAIVRGAVASNDSTPYQASPIIAADKNVDVRLALATRLVKLLPEISADTRSQLYSFTVDALETLANDEVSKIRITLAQTLKNELHAPVHIITKLARDIEQEVAEPILNTCLNVPDDVLLEILANHPAAWKVEAIAQRRYVSAAISDAIIDASNENAGVMLLDNKDADIEEKTLFRIVDKSRAFTQWQKPLAVRTFLPEEVAKKLAEFVDDSVKSILSKRNGFDAEAAGEVGDKFRKDLKELEKNDLETMSPEDRVRKLIADNTLNEDAIIDSINRRDRVFTIVALAAMTRTNRGNMETILGVGKAKALIAVCWKAGLSMRTCLRIQQEVAKIPSKELIYPRGGTDYPLEADEIKWQLEFLGLAPKA